MDPLFLAAAPFAIYINPPTSTMTNGLWRNFSVEGEILTQCNSCGQLKEVENVNLVLQWGLGKTIASFEYISGVWIEQARFG